MPENLRIGIDGRILGGHLKGMARYIWELCKGLDVILPRAEFYLYSREHTGLPPISNRWYERSDGVLGRRLPKSLWAVMRPAIMGQRDRLDVYWGGAGLIPLMGPYVRSVLGVHDLVYKLMPEAMSARARWAMKMFFEPSLSRADAVVTNSHGTADRLRAITGHKADAVVLPGISSEFRPQPETKIDTVLARHSLVLVGDRGWRDSSLAQLLSSSGSRINWLGFVEDEELIGLYSGCDVFVYPSKYEGFGMPVLEARACGARIVTSDSPELREAGGSDPIYVIPNESGIASGILAAISSRGKAALDWRKQTWRASSVILASTLTNEDCSYARSAN